ncbi:hypothetical protein Trydic_g6108 [Trypoxylus dichotomus]
MVTSSKSLQFGDSNIEESTNEMIRRRRKSECDIESQHDAESEFVASAKSARTVNTKIESTKAQHCVTFTWS